MNSKQKAVEEIRKFAKSLQGFLALAEELERVASIEQAANEADQRYEAALRKCEQAEVDLKAADQKVGEACDFAKRTEAVAQENAGQMIALAEERAAMIHAKADRQAADRLAEMNSQLNKANDAFAQLKLENAHVASEISEKQAILKDLNAQIALIRERVK